MKTKTQLLKIGVYLGTILIVSFLIVGIVNYFVNQSPNWLWISLIVSFIILVIFFIILYWNYKNENFLLQREISEISSQLSVYSSEKTKSGIIIYNEDQKIVFISNWLHNKGFQQFLGKKLSFLGINNLSNSIIYKFKLKTNFYSLEVSQREGAIFVKDVTEIQNLVSFLKTKNIAVITMKFSFLSNLNSSIFEKTKIELNISDYLNQWAKSNKVVFGDKVVFDVPFVAFTHWKNLKKFVLSETNSLYDVMTRNLKEEKEFVNLAFGVSYGFIDIHKLKDFSLEALKIAESRGGDQLILREEKGNYVNFGKSTIGVQKTEKLEIKSFYENLVKELKTYKNILITSHINVDYDALSSAIAINTFLKEQLKINTKIFIESFDDATKEFAVKFMRENPDYFLVDNVDEYISIKTGLIVLDVNNVERIQNIDVFKKFNKEAIFVIDHHRIGQNSIDVDKKNIYVDVNISSTAEIIVEILRFHHNDSVIKNYKEIATLLLSGVYLDTNHLKRNVSSRTHENISYLINCGASEKQAIKNLNKISIEENSKYFAYMFNNFQWLRKNIVFVSFEEDKIMMEHVIASLCDELLNFKDVEAGFLLAKISNDKWKLSARSNSKINVQYILEKLNGGGHFNSAGAIFTSESVEDIKKKLLKELDLYLED